MADETHKLQEEPPEGSRKVIEHELKRQAGGGRDTKSSGSDPKSPEDSGKSDPAKSG